MNKKNLRKIVGHVYRKTKYGIISKYNFLFNTPKKKDVLFIHIPRTAGTSITKSLWSYGHRKLKTPTNYENFDNKGFVTFGHVSVFYLLDKGIINKEFFDNAFKFSFVRNPWDRLVSLFFYIKNSKNKKPFGDPEWLEECSFKEFCKKLKEEKIPPIGKYNVKGLSQASPQVCWIVNDKGNLIVDFLGKFENLNEDIHKLYKKIGIKTSLDKTHPTTRKKDYKEYYDKETRKIVEEIYSEDIKRFGYTF